MDFNEDEIELIEKAKISMAKGLAPRSSWVSIEDLAAPVEVTVRSVRQLHARSKGGASAPSARWPTGVF